MNERKSERSANLVSRHQNNAFEEQGAHNRELQIAIVVFPGFSSLDVAIIDQIFHYANQVGVNNERRYRVKLLSSNGGLVDGASKMRVWSDVVARSPMDVVFVSGGDGVDAASRDVRLLRWFRELCRQAKLLIGVAEGRSLIAAAGVSFSVAAEGTRLRQRPGEGMSGRVDSMAGQYHIYDPCGALLSALSVVKRDLGVLTAREIGERLVPDSSRWLSAILGAHGEDTRRDRIRATADWIEQNCDRPLSMADISQFALMSERTLLRHFKAVMGMTPSDYVLKARFELACRLLISTALPIDKVARRCGFSSGMALAKLFRKRLSVSASEFRAAARPHHESHLGGDL